LRRSIQHALDYGIAAPGRFLVAVIVVWALAVVASLIAHTGEDSTVSIKSKLTDLTLRHPSQADIDEINRQIDAEDNDRGAAVLAVTLVENALAYAISRRDSRFSYRHKKLFQYNGLFSTLYARITLAEAMNIFGPVTNHNLDLIKHIRNVFAHASVPVKFSTPEINEACLALKAPSDLKGKAWGTPREKYVAACYAIVSELADYASRCHRRRADILEPATMVTVTPTPLP
jgi:hypothetical protein